MGVDREERVPHVVVGVLQPCTARQPSGVVHQHVDAAERLRRERHEGLALRTVADVRRGRDGATAGRDDGGGGLLGDVAVEVAEHDARPALGQELAVRPAHAARAAGDDGDAPGERPGGAHADAAAEPTGTPTLCGSVT